MSKIIKILIGVVLLGLLVFIRINNKKTNEKMLFTEKNEETEIAIVPDKIELKIPFTAQAPLGNWEDVKQGNGCEEASILMVYSWIKDKEIEKESALEEIQKMSDFSLKLIGHFHDISNEDTIKLFKEYFEFEDLFLEKEITIEKIKKRLLKGKALIVAVNGDILANPYYQIPKPANHKLVIIGYDENTQEFITNDPGTSKGEGFRYKYNQLLESITDYPTGYRQSFETVTKSMIVVEK